MPPAGRFASVAMNKLIPSATAAAVIQKIAAHMSIPANAPAVHFVTAWVCSYSDDQIGRIGVAQIAHAGAWNAAKAIESMKANGTPAVAAFAKEHGQAAVDGMADWLERYNRFFGRPVSGSNANPLPFPPMKNPNKETAAEKIAKAEIERKEAFANLQKIRAERFAIKPFPICPSPAEVKAFNRLNEAEKTLSRLIGQNRRRNGGNA